MLCTRVILQASPVLHVFSLAGGALGGGFRPSPLTLSQWERGEPLSKYYVW